MVANQQRIVEAGPQAGLTLSRGGREVPMRDWATTLMNEMRPIADLLDRRRRRRLTTATRGSNNARVSKIPTARRRRASSRACAKRASPFFRFAMNQSIMHKGFFVANPLNDEKLAYFESLAERSHQADQRAIEAGRYRKPRRIPRALHGRAVDRGRVNFLAHCALGERDSAALPRRRLSRRLRQGHRSLRICRRRIQTGIRLHRRIDAFSAVQADIKASVARLPQTSRRLAPVFIDLVADHFLARHFETVHGEPLAEFSRPRLRDSGRARSAPAGSTPVRFSRFMRDHDLFGRYVELEPVERAFRAHRATVSERRIGTGVDGGATRRLSRRSRRTFCATTRRCASTCRGVACVSELPSDVSAAPRSC